MKIEIVPANKATWEDLEAILGGVRCHGDACYCQRFRLGWGAWRSTSDDERAHMLRVQTDCGHPGSDTTSGLVAYVDGEPAAWCAIAPRSDYYTLGQTPWKTRAEDKDDDTVWAVTCFVVRKDFRGRGITHALARTAVEYARDRGARALEGYPMITEPGKEITWGELHVGSRNAFAAAGCTQVSHPSPRRVVMRIDF